MIHYHIKKEDENLWLQEKSYSPEFAIKTESVFTQSNGYIGIRGSHDFKTLEENRGMFIGGVYQKPYENEVIELTNCPDLIEAQLKIDDQLILIDRCKIREYNRSFHLQTGALTIRYLIETENQKTLSIKSRRFLSSADKHLLCHEIMIALEQDGDARLTLTTGINGQITNSGVSHFRQVDCRVYDKKCMELVGKLEKNTVHILSEVACNVTYDAEYCLRRRSIYGSYKTLLSSSRPVIFTKYSYIRDTDATKEDAFSKLNSHQKKTYNFLYSEHKHVMQDFWKYANIEIAGAGPDEEAAIKFAQYHLQGMAPKDTCAYSVGAKGLTGEGYKGHIFWDTELFVMPFFEYVFPEAAKNLLRFRYHGLEGARQKAKDYGYAGAMYPWETALDGYEETPLYAALNIHTGKANKVWSGIKEDHVTADIAYALWQYYTLTNDEDFLQTCGYEMIFDIARFWVSRSVFNKEKDRFEILDTIGPDEYTEHIDNNAYTNYLAAFCVRLALNIIEDASSQLRKNLTSRYCRETEITIWMDYLLKLYLPQPNNDGIIPQDDSFLSKPVLTNMEYYKKSPIKQKILFDYARNEVVDMQVLKQADTVMLLNLFPVLFSADIVKKNVLYYENRTLHDSSLSYCAHAQACAAIGEGEMAWDFFQKAMIVDLDDNPKDTNDGIHAASLGGIWNCTIFGFAGISHDKKGLTFSPCLPPHWNSINFHIKVRGIYIKVQVSAKEIILKAQNAFAEPLQITVKENHYHLQTDLIIHL